MNSKRIDSNKLRRLYVDFFVSRGHREIDPSPLVLEEDPTTLFTSSGMQPLIPYLLGKSHPSGKRLVNSQPSFRAEDINEVGDNRHTTFFEMLGNWSLGDYFKKEQISWFFEFLTKDLNLPKEKLYITVFEGANGVAKDEESAEIWKNLGISESHIFYYGVKKNWWSRSGTPREMPKGEIGGPDSEVFYEFTQVSHNPKYGNKCHPNCDCGRFLEIGNSVFIQYKKSESGRLEELSQKNVDFGGGLERIQAALLDNPDIFRIDLFWPVIEAIQTQSGKSYQGFEKELRIMADHLKAATFIASAGVVPANKDRGYILRRLLRRSLVYARMLGFEVDGKTLSKLIDPIILIYEETPWGESLKNKPQIQEIFEEEAGRFAQTISRGLAIIEKEKEDVDEERAFDLFQTYGFPFELTAELLGKFGKTLKREIFDERFKQHQRLSQEKSSAKFKTKRI